MNDQPLLDTTTNSENNTRRFTKVEGKANQPILPGSVSLSNFFKMWGNDTILAKRSNDLVGFKGWPGNARARGKAKRRAKKRLSEGREYEVKVAIPTAKKQKQSHWWQLRGLRRKSVAK